MLLQASPTVTTETTGFHIALLRVSHIVLFFKEGIADNLHSTPVRNKGLRYHGAHTMLQADWHGTGSQETSEIISVVFCQQPQNSHFPFASILLHRDGSKETLSFVRCTEAWRQGALSRSQELLSVTEKASEVPNNLHSQTKGYMLSVLSCFTLLVNIIL